MENLNHTKTVSSQNLSVQIVRFVDDAFPGWVESQFVDATGCVHTIVDKYPTFTGQIIDARSTYPLPGELRCEILSRTKNSDGADLVRISIPGIESTEGISEFVVLQKQLSEPIQQFGG